MRRILVLVAVLAIALPTAAHAVWGGQEDFAHPGVGAMYFDFMGNGVAVPDGLVCSGSYAGRSANGANDVFLTAGHCLPPAELGIPASALLVSFDRDGRDGVSSPIKAARTTRCRASGMTSETSTTWRSCSCPRDRFPQRFRPCSCRRRVISSESLATTLADDHAKGLEHAADLVGEVDAGPHELRT